MLQVWLYLSIHSLNNQEGNIPKDEAAELY